jgi:AcrR family transcriptional regulator
LHGDFKQTHEKILNSAKQNFLARGYERTNLRKICKDAAVTTGAFYRHFPDKESLFIALVESAVQGIKNIYMASEEECLDFLNNNAIDQAYQVPYKVVADFINYIYDDFDCFKLLLMCSDGTKYVNFVNDMVILEVDEREKLFKILKKGNFEFHEPRKEESHLLTHSYFSSIFEVVTHDFTKEEAHEYAHTLVTFYNAGWRAILGI